MLQLAAIVDADPRCASAGGALRAVSSPAPAARPTSGPSPCWAARRWNCPPARCPARCTCGAQPRRPYDMQVEVWLDPARHHLPVRAAAAARRGSDEQRAPMPEAGATRVHEPLTSGRRALKSRRSVPSATQEDSSMQMLYNSDSFVVVQFDVPADGARRRRRGAAATRSSTSSRARRSSSRARWPSSFQRGVQALMQQGRQRRGDRRLHRRLHRTGAAAASSCTEARRPDARRERGGLPRLPRPGLRQDGPTIVVRREAARDGQGSHRIARCVLSPGLAEARCSTPVLALRAHADAAAGRPLQPAARLEQPARR